jgi:hypothetical protein
VAWGKKTDHEKKTDFKLVYIYVCTCNNSMIHASILH